MHTWKPRDESRLTTAKSKVLTKTEECDVMSLLDESVQKKSVKEAHRLEHLKRKFAQCYMKSAWEDFSFES